MENGLTTLSIAEIEEYVNSIIPNIEDRLTDPRLTDKEMLELYQLYRDVLKLVAPHNFQTFNKYLEIEEDKSNPNRGFYHHRQKHLAELFDALNDMEIYDKYDTLLISCPPRVGKSTAGIRFLAWIIGRHPENTQLATSYSDSITTSFYIGVMEIVQNELYAQVFPDAPLIAQNAKREEIWLKIAKRYPSITFVPINGSMTGRAEAGNYLYCDDLVSGIEEAMSLPRMEKLWQTYSVNARQRKKSNAKEIHIATRWSVHDPITKLDMQNDENPRCKSIKLPCFDENGNSNFDFFGGFNTKYYEDQRNSMDEISFNALYMQEPIEREGILYHKDDLQYFFELPDERPDSIISVCDSKNLGSDSVSAPVGYVYGDFVYIDDVVFNNGLPEITRPLVADLWTKHNVVRADVEMNNGGNYYAEDLQEMLRDRGSKTSIRMFFTSNNKATKIITYSDFVKKYFIFRHPSTYNNRSDYHEFMQEVFRYSQTGKVKHDDAPDALAMLAQLVQDLQGNAVKVINRREIGL